MTLCKYVFFPSLLGRNIAENFIKGSTILNLYAT